MNDILFSFLSKIASGIEGVENEKDMLIRLIVSAVIFLVLVIFRNQISKAVVWVLCKIFKGSGDKAQRAIKYSLTKPLAFFVAVSGFYGATEIIAPSGEARNFAAVILKLGMIIFVSWSAVNFINSDYSVILKGDVSKSKKTAVKFISNISKGAVAVIAVLLILEQFGISASRIFAALGIGGVAVAFACKDAVENMLSGFIIIFDKPFEVDDVIEINGETGTVEDIKIRTTRVRAVDGSEKIYPNTVMAGATLTNWTKMKKRSFTETLWINYKHSRKDIEEFCAGLRKMIDGFDNVLKEDVRVNFSEYGTHALEINMFFYVDTVRYADYQKFGNDLNLAIKEYADNSDIELAFTSNTVYFGDELKITQK